MGEEVKVEHFIMKTEDGPGFVWSGIKTVAADFSEDPVDMERIVLGPMECSFTATLKFPKFFRCKSRKRYKKLLMSLSKIDRNYIDGYLKCIDHMRTVNPKFALSYQELWNEIRINVFGI